MCIQGKETLLVEVYAYFKNLETVLKQMTGIVGQLDGVELLTIASQGEVVASASGADGTYVVKGSECAIIF